MGSPALDNQGGLGPSKMFLVYGWFLFVGSKWTYNTNKSQIQLEVHNAKGQLTPIVPQLAVMEAQHTLGVCVAPDSNNKAELEQTSRAGVVHSDDTCSGSLQFETCGFKKARVPTCDNDLV